jgi:hypothetical protein
MLEVIQALQALCGIAQISAIPNRDGNGLRMDI